MVTIFAVKNVGFVAHRFMGTRHAFTEIDNCPYKLDSMHVSCPLTHTLYLTPIDRCTELPAVPFQISRSSLVPGLLPGAKLDILFPGFPSLKHVDHSARLEKRGVRVFQAASRDENMCLSVRPKPMDEVSLHLINATCIRFFLSLSESPKSCY